MSKDFCNWLKFSRLESKITEKSKIKIKKTGNKITGDKYLMVINKYTNKKIKDLKKTVFLKTAINT